MLLNAVRFLQTANLFQLCTSLDESTKLFAYLHSCQLKIFFPAYEYNLSVHSVQNRLHALVNHDGGSNTFSLIRCEKANWIWEPDKLLFRDDFEFTRHTQCFTHVYLFTDEFPDFRTIHFASVNWFSSRVVILWNEPPKRNDVLLAFTQYYRIPAIVTVTNWTFLSKTYW